MIAPCVQRNAGGVAESIGEPGELGGGQFQPTCQVFGRAQQRKAPVLEAGEIGVLREVEVNGLAGDRTGKQVRRLLTGGSSGAGDRSGSRIGTAGEAHASRCDRGGGLRARDFRVRVRAGGRGPARGAEQQAPQPVEQVHGERPAGGKNWPAGCPTESGGESEAVADTLAIQIPIRMGSNESSCRVALQWSWAEAQSRSWATRRPENVMLSEPPGGSTSRPPWSPRFTFVPRPLESPSMQGVVVQAQPLLPERAAARVGD